MQTSMIPWKHLRQGQGKNFQSYTQEIKRKALSLGIPLHTHETLLKYYPQILGITKEIMSRGPQVADMEYQETE
jgi:hypothetical protein